MSQKNEDHSRQLFKIFFSLHNIHYKKLCLRVERSY